MHCCELTSQATFKTQFQKKNELGCCVLSDSKKTRRKATMGGNRKVLFLFYAATDSLVVIRKQMDSLDFQDTSISKAHPLFSSNITVFKKS